MPDMTPEQKLLNVIKTAQGRVRVKKELKVFTKINLVLIVLIAVIFSVFLIDVFTFDSKKPRYKLDLPVDKVDIPEAAETAPAEEAADLGALTQQPAAVISKKDIVKNLSVLGTVKGENDQVIIEDKEKNKTFFLYKGDSFGDFRVVDIKEGRVTLDYKGEEIDLNI